MGEEKNPKETTESEVVSRRSFMRKSAEVAALSLFGVLGLDAVADKVLERIAESRAMGRLADSAAGALKRERLDYFAQAQNLPKHYCEQCYSNTMCPLAYNCVEPHDNGCPHCVSDVGCQEYNPDCDPYGCTDRQLNCGVKLTCPTEINCNGQSFDCGYSCPKTVAFDCAGFHYP